MALLIADRDLAVEGGQASDHAFPPDHGGFDHLAGGQLHDERNDSRMRKEDAVDRTAGLEQNHFLRQLDRSQMRQEQVDVGRRQGGQHVVGRMSGEGSHIALLPLQGGSAVASLGD
jgi:hypothetical protein